LAEEALGLGPFPRRADIGDAVRGERLEKVALGPN
jgi:hypothetical protein